MKSIAFLIVAFAISANAQNLGKTPTCGVIDEMMSNKDGSLTIGFVANGQAGQKFGNVLKTSNQADMIVLSTAKTTKKKVCIYEITGLGSDETPATFSSVSLGY